MSTEAAQSSIHDLAIAVNRVLQSNEIILQRLTNIESYSVAYGRHDRSTPRPYSMIDDVSTMTPEIVSAQTREPNPRVDERCPSPRHGISQFDRYLESELYASRVYLRASHRRSISSKFSEENSVSGLSILSEISLAQISNFSMISLPIFYHEIWNPQQFMNLADSVLSPDPMSLNDISRSIKDPKRPQHGFARFERLISTINRAQVARQRSKILLLGEQILASICNLARLNAEPNAVGADQAGKSTIMKQMQFAYLHKYDASPQGREERVQTSQVIYSNIVVALSIILEFMKQLGCQGQLVNHVFFVMKASDANHLSSFTRPTAERWMIFQELISTRDFPAIC